MGRDMDFPLPFTLIAPRSSRGVTASILNKQYANKFDAFIQGGSGHWAVYYTSPQVLWKRFFACLLNNFYCFDLFIK